MSLPSQDKKGVSSGCYNAVGVFGTALGVAVFETVFSLGISQQGPIAEVLAKNPGAAVHGYSMAFIAGTILAILAAVFSGLNIKRNHKRTDKQLKKHFLQLHH